MMRRHAFYFFAPLALWLVEALLLPWSGPLIRLAEPLLLFGFCVAVRERLAPALAVILWTAVLYQTISASMTGFQIAAIALTALTARKILQYFIPRPGVFASGAAALVIILILSYGVFAAQTSSYH